MSLLRIARFAPAAASIAVISAVSAAEIQSVDLTNFGPFDPAVTVRVLYDRPAGEAGAVSYGEIGWDVVKAIDPGITVYNNVPPYKPQQDYADCVMAPRTYAITGDVDKKCNDEFQTHKRFKMNATAIGPIDVRFKVKRIDNALQILDAQGNVVANDGDLTRNVYRMIGKLNNHTGRRLAGMKVEVGFGLGASFVASTTADQLRIVNQWTPTDEAYGDDEMAQFPGGLFYEKDTRTDWGFFSSSRAGFTVNTAAFATEQENFSSTTLFGEYESLFGKWLPINWAPPGWFEDTDGDPATDAEARAWFDGKDWISYEVDPATGARTKVIVDAATLVKYQTTAATVWDDDGDMSTRTGGTLYATWDNAKSVWILADGTTIDNDAMAVRIADTTDALNLERRPGYVRGPIEDLANLNLNYYIELGEDISKWPGFNADTLEATFTLRLTPIAADEKDNVVPAWVGVEPPVASLPPATTDPVPTATDDDGGCTMNPNARFDAGLLGLLLAAAGALAVRRVRRRA